jgi:hypothetical protein
MAHARIHPDHSSSGAAPWAAFVLGMVVVLAAIAVFLVATGQATAPFRNLDLKVHGPSLADLKLPDAPPMPRG